MFFAMDSKLVSVITPCYNTGKYVHRLLDSVLTQSYEHIEMIVVNDGSTDNTQEVLQSYVPKFAARGYRLECISQPNSGQSVAIQNALERISGKYLVWPDSDDYYASPYAIERMVDRLESLPDEYAMVRSQEHVVTDDAEQRILYTFGVNGKECEDKSLFVDCLLQINGFYFTPGAYMVKTAALMRSSSMPIFTAKAAGQNWQLMLPVLYHYRCSTILEPLYRVVWREGSHSREKNNFTQYVEKQQLYAQTILATLDRIESISGKDKQRYGQMVRVKYANLLFEKALEVNSAMAISVFYPELKSLGCLSMRQRVKAFMFRCGLLRTAKYAKNVVRKLIRD